MDEEEDRRYGRDKRGDELPEDLAFREGRLRKIREARAALEAEVHSEVEQARAEGRDHPGEPYDRAQWNFTDPDSRITPVSGGRDFQDWNRYSDRLSRSVVSGSGCCWAWRRSTGNGL